MHADGFQSALALLCIMALHLLPALVVYGEVRHTRMSRTCDPDLHLDQPPDRVLSGTRLQCTSVCGADEDCTAMAFYAPTRTCHMFHTLPQPTCPNLTPSTGAAFYIKDLGGQICLNGGVWNEGAGKCDCVENYAGARCGRLAYDCSEINNFAPPPGEDMVNMLIQPESAPQPFWVKCYVNWGGFTYIMERFHDCPRVSFNQGWQAYRDGFGPTDYSCDFWLGLEKIHHLTNSPGRRSTLDITVYFQEPNMPNEFYQSYYPDFVVGDEAGGYTASASSYQEQPAFPLGDALWLSGSGNDTIVGQPFSTLDHDQDASTSNCAQDFQSGWWFNSCGKTNLNGPWVWTGSLRSSQDPSIWWGSTAFTNKAIHSVNIKIKFEPV